MIKAVLSGLLLIGLCTYLMWPSSPPGLIPPEKGLIPSPTEKLTSKKERHPQRTAALKRLQKVVPQPSAKAHIERKVSKNGVDSSYINEQEVIEEVGYGTFPEVSLKEMNPHKEHLLNALQDPQNNSGAISIVGKREKFNLAEYRKDSSAYINSVEPGRVFDVAAPGIGVKRIERVGSSSLQSLQNETVLLTAKSLPGMPVSYTAYDGGQFQNGLAFITIKADSRGQATAEFTPTAGVINQARISAGSPVNSGSLQWKVFVKLPTKNNKN